MVSLPANEYIRFHHAGDITLKAGHAIPSRQLQDYELVYFPSATHTIYTCEQVRYELSFPCVLLTRPGETHAYQFDPNEPTRHIFVHFDGISARTATRYPLLDKQSAHSVIRMNEHSLIPSLMRQLLYYFYKRPERWLQMAEVLFMAVLEEMESTAMERASRTSEDEIPIPKPIMNALQYIDNHIHVKIEIEQLAAASGWSHEHFTRTFQRLIGHSPSEWVNKRKMERAAQMVLQSNDPIKKIAPEVGFADVYHFHRVFRRWMGMTASQYRIKYGDPRFRELVPAEDWSRFYPLNHFFVLEDPDL